MTNNESCNCKPKISNFDFDILCKYVLNTIWCIFFPVFLIPILFVANIVFYLSFLFAFFLLVLSVVSFFRMRLYAKLVDICVFSKRHFVLENYSFVICVIFALSIMFIEYFTSHNNIMLSNFNLWIVFKVLVFVYSIFTGFVLFGISYEKNRRIINSESKIRNKDKTNVENISDSVPNMTVSTTIETSTWTKVCVYTFCCIFMSVFFPVLIFIKDLVVIKISLFVYTNSVFLFARLYAKKVSYRSKTHWIENSFFAISAVFTIVTIILNIIFDNTVTLGQFSWLFLFARIIMLLIMFCSGIMFFISALSIKNKIKNKAVLENR